MSRRSSASESGIAADRLPESHYQQLLDVRPSDWFTRSCLGSALDALGDIRGLGYFLLALNRRYPRKFAGNWVWTLATDYSRERHVLPAAIFSRLYVPDGSLVAVYATRQAAEDDAATAWSIWFREEEQLCETSQRDSGTIETS